MARHFRSDAAANPGTLRQRLSEVPRTVWLITALWAALLVGASVLWPNLYGYDEPQHIDMAYVYSSSPFHFYGPGDLSNTRALVGMEHMVPGFFSRKLPFSQAPTTPRGDRPTFSALGGHAFVRGSGPNQMVQHPPLYYWLEAVVLRVPGVSHLGWDLEVWLMRLLSVLLMLPLPLLCWATARRLLVHHEAGTSASADSLSRYAVLAAVIPLSVPNLIRDGSSVTNDTLLILTTSVLLYLLSRVLTGDLSRRTAAGVALSLAAALLTKGFALVLPPVVLAAYLVGGWRPGAGAAPVVRAIWRPLAIAAVGGVVGGLWWLRNLIDYHAVQVSGYAPGYQRVLYGPPDNRGTLFHFVPQFFNDVVGRIWGGIGVPDAPSPGPFIIWGWFFVVVLGLVAAIASERTRARRLRTFVLLSAPLLTLLVVAQGSYSTFRHWSVTTHGTQGRYLYQTLVVIAALAAIGWYRVLQPRARAVLIPAMLVAALVTNAGVWFLVLRAWYAPAGGLGVAATVRGDVHGLLRWSPLPALPTVVLVAVLPVVLGVAAAASAIRDARELGQAAAGEDDLNGRAGARDLAGV